MYGFSIEEEGRATTGQEKRSDKSTAYVNIATRSFALPKLRDIPGMTDKGDENNAVMPRLIPRGKIAIPVVSPRSDANGTTSSFAPASEKADQQPKEDEESRVTTAAAEEPPSRQVRPAFQPISPGLSNVTLPLGPGPKVAVKGEAEPVRDSIKPVLLSVSSICRYLRPYINESSGVCVGGL